MDIVELLRKDEKSMLVDGQVKLVNWVAADEIERLWKQLEETSTKHERLVFLTMGDLSLRDIEIKGLREEVDRLRKRFELLESYLNGALNVIEGFVHCDTTEARKTLEGNE